MSGILSGFGIFFLRLISYLPLKALFIISDIFFILIYYVVKYRKQVVISNITKSFPEMDNKEVLNVSKLFYKHLCDTMFETVKNFSFEKGNWKKHIDLSDISILNKYYERGESVIVLSFHYGNWEWSKFISPVARHLILFVYSPQHNAMFDDYFNKVRSKFGGQLVSTSRIYKEILKYQDQNSPTFTWLAADQTPVKSKFWTMFLNQETPFFPGPGKIALRTNQPLLLQYMEKTERGKYKCVVEPLIDNPSALSEHEILQIYANRIEEIIKINPQYYLWSHRRWKRKRPEGIPLFKK